MSVPKIFRSSDVGAPVMLGSPGTLISLLDACLIDGYGSTFASGTITSDGVNVVAGDTLTIGSITYTFQSSIGSQPANTIAYGVNATSTMSVIRDVVLGLPQAGTLSPGSTLSSDVLASLSGLVLTITARKGGSAGNSIALSRTSAGTPHFSVSASTLTGGGGTNTKASAGWTKPFSGPTAYSQAVYQQPAGCGFYLQVDDNGPGAGMGAEARTFGFETMSAWNTGSGQFPTVAQNAGGAVSRKVYWSARDVVRPWLLIADDRTFYLFILTGDTADYIGYAFGDFYSFNSADPYKCLVIGKNAESGTTQSSHPFAQQIYSQTSGVMSGGGHWLARNFAGIGGPTAFTKVGDYGLSGGSNLTGTMAFPNPSDGGLYISPLRVTDGSTPAVNISGNPNLRGRMRGLWHAPYAPASFADGDTFQGSGELAGRNFMVVKPVLGVSTNSAYVILETTAWDTSA